MQRISIVTLMAHFALVSGCDERPEGAPPVPVLGLPDVSVEFDRGGGSWTREAPFVCQEGFACDQPAYCVDEHHYVEVESASCCVGEACPLAACEPILPARACPSGTVCRHLRSAGVTETGITVADEFERARELLAPACVAPAAVAADAGQASGPFAGNCGNGSRDDFELCDDANQVSGDGCSRFCTLEPDWSCFSFGQPCRLMFGDPECSANACRVGAFCVDTFEGEFLPSPLGMSCECPAGALPECPPLRALGLPRPSRASECWGAAISADGGTIVGECAFESTADADRYARVDRAVRWTIAGVVEVYPGDGSSAAHDVSADGSVVVGRSSGRPFVWDGAQVRLLGEELGARLIVEGRRVVGISVSADGTVVVGGEAPAWVWTEADGVRELPAATAGRLAVVIGVSPDGSRILGFEVGRGTAEFPLSWTIGGQVEVVPVVPDPEARIVASNTDGSLLVINTVNHPPSPDQVLIPRVVLWTAAGSTTLAPDGGRALALSADGSVLLGQIREVQQTLVWRLGQANTFEAVNAIGVRDVSGDGRVLAGSIGDPSIGGDGSLGGSRRARIQWLP